jgi:CelD/BcsL family acetyltransferase involved in cellulose biosynthesis
VAVQVNVVRPGELGPSEAALWLRFQQRLSVTLNPFLSLTFARAIGRARPNARVAVIEDDGRIEAFLAYELATRTIARPIGWPMNDLQGFVSSGAPLDARSIVRMAGLRGWRFDHAFAEQQPLDRFHYRGTSVRSLEIDLSNGYQAYLENRPKSVTRAGSQRRRALQRQFGTVSLEWGTSSTEHLRQLIAWKSLKYYGTQELFFDPSAQQILEELATTSNEDCGGLLSVLIAGERPVAIHFGLTSPRGICSWFHAYDQELARYSPGIMMLFALAEEATARSITRIDLGYGQDRYKFRLATPSYTVFGGAVWANSGEAAGRALYRWLVNTLFDRRDEQPELASGATTS